MNQLKGASVSLKNAAAAAKKSPEGRLAKMGKMATAEAAKLFGSIFFADQSANFCDRHKRVAAKAENSPLSTVG